MAYFGDDSGRIWHAEPPRFMGEALERSRPGRPTAISAGRTVAWAATVPGEDAVPRWLALRSMAEPGWWPVILGGAQDEGRIATRASGSAEALHDIVAGARRVDADELLARWRTEAQARLEGSQAEGGRDMVGTWPDKPPSSHAFVLPFHEQSWTPRPTVLAVIAVEHHWEVPAALAWGHASGRTPAEHVALLRHWSTRYRAELVGISTDIIEMNVGRPPTTPDAALALAFDQYAYDPSLLDGGLGTLNELAASLLGSSAWYFTWA